MWEDNIAEGFDPSDFRRKSMDSGGKCRRCLLYTSDAADESVGVVDERSELGACHLGIAQNELGIRTDILDGCPKAEGMLMLIRSMAPKILAIDEIGAPEDIHAMEYAMHCGCCMLATVHGTSMAEVQKKPVLQQLIQKKRFGRYVVLKNGIHIGEVEGIYDERGTLLYREQYEKGACV